MLSAERILELMSIAEKATPGKWQTTFYTSFQETPESPDKPVRTIAGSGPVHHEDTGSKQAFADMNHIAAFDPPTVQQILRMALAYREMRYWLGGTDREYYEAKPHKAMELVMHIETAFEKAHEIMAGKT